MSAINRAILKFITKWWTFEYENGQVTIIIRFGARCIIRGSGYIWLCSCALNSFDSCLAATIQSFSIGEIPRKRFFLQFQRCMSNFNKKEASVIVGITIVSEKMGIQEFRELYQFIWMILSILSNEGMKYMQHPLVGNHTSLWITVIAWSIITFSLCSDFLVFCA